MVTRARVKMLRSLHRREGRAVEGLYLVEGRRLVTEALRFTAVEELLVTERFAAAPSAGEALHAAAAAGVTADRLPEADLARLSDTKTPQGILAVCRRPPADPSVLEGNGLFLVLDSVADPGNVGTLVRAADAFGARAVVAGPGSADFENMKVLRAAMGSTFHIPCVSAGDLSKLLSTSRESGARVLAATLDGEDLFTLSSPGPRIFVVLGNEARGVSESTRANADHLVTVPCPGRAESLNVAMAGAIVLSCLARGMGGER